MFRTCKTSSLTIPHDRIRLFRRLDVIEEPPDYRILSQTTESQMRTRCLLHFSTVFFPGLTDFVSMSKRVLSLRTTLVKKSVPYTVMRRQYINNNKKEEEEEEFYNDRMVACREECTYPSYSVSGSSGFPKDRCRYLSSSGGKRRNCQHVSK